MKTDIRQNSQNLQNRKGSPLFPSAGILFIMLILSLLPVHAAGFRITQTITLTNSANLTNGIKFTLNGDARTGEDIVTNAATEFARSNRIDYATTNLLAHIGAHPFAGVSIATSTATNNIVLVGNTNVVMVGSFFGAWGNVTNVTNVVYGASPYATPYTVESNAFRIWQQNIVVSNLVYATELLRAAMAPFSFLGTNGGLRNMWASNLVVTNLSSPGPGLISLQLGEGAYAAGNYSLAIGYHATNAAGAQSTIVGNESYGDGDYNTIFGNNSYAASNKNNVTIIGPFFFATNANFGAVTVGSGGTLSSATFGPMADNQFWIASASESVWIPGALHVQKLSQFGLVTATNLHATNLNAGINGGSVKLTNAAIAASGITATNLDASVATIHSGNVTSTVVQATSVLSATIATTGAGNIGGNVVITNSLTASNLTVTTALSVPTATVTTAANFKDVVTGGTNRFDYAVSFTRTNITSLANGANDLDPGLRAYLKVSGPSAAYSIDKIDKGWDGRRLLIQKSDAFTLTIPNNSGSGVLPDAAKILTGTGATLTITNNPGFVELIYDSDASRWGVIRASN